MSAPARSYRGHSTVRHGPGDWRCVCGTPLRSWRWGDDGDEGQRIPMTGRSGARDAMRFHRSTLWMDSAEQEAGR